MLHSTTMSIVIALVSLPLITQAQTQSIQLDSSVPLSSLEQGKTLYQQGQYDEALAFLQDAVRVENRSAPAHYWLGMA